MSDDAAGTVLEWRGRTGPFTVSLGRGVFHPTHTSRTIAEALEIDDADRHRSIKPRRSLQLPAVGQC